VTIRSCPGGVSDDGAVVVPDAVEGLGQRPVSGRFDHVHLMQPVVG
jgi:hypothetical protein